MSPTRKSLSLITVLAVSVLTATVLLLPDSTVKNKATVDHLQSWIGGGWKNWGATKWKADGFYNPPITQCREVKDPMTMSRAS